VVHGVFLGQFTTRIRKQFMKWQAKYMVKRGLSLMPFGMEISMNHWLSSNFGELRDSPEYAVPNTLGMVGLLEKLGYSVKGKRFVELCTGWSGSSPLVLLSLGAECVESYDLFRPLEQNRGQRALALFDSLEPYTSREFPFDVDLRHVANRCSKDRIDLERFHYFAPHDARSTGLSSESADVYYSSAVLEHESYEVLPQIHAETYRILKRGGIFYHYVQPTMHAVQVDPRATGIDYLCCSDWMWRLFFENDIAHENRLRHVDHIRLLEAAGFEIIANSKTIDQRALAALPNRKLAGHFESYSQEELATDYCWIVGRKP
jgi:hypothetical protein